MNARGASSRRGAQPVGLTPPVAPSPDLEEGEGSPEGAGAAGRGVTGAGVGVAGAASPAAPDPSPPSLPEPCVAGAVSCGSEAPPLECLAALGDWVVGASPLAGASVWAPAAVVLFFALPAEEVWLARLFSTWMAESMKLCQMSAGKVPPSTGLPPKSVVIGTRLFG